MVHLSISQSPQTSGPPARSSAFRLSYRPGLDGHKDDLAKRIPGNHAAHIQAQLREVVRALMRPRTSRSSRGRRHDSGNNGGSWPSSDWATFVHPSQ
jgi:hypothetical protein